MTDASKMSVEHAAITSHVQSLQQHNQTLQQESKRFMEVIEPLQSTWKGSSVGSWEQMTQAWSESMNGVNSALGEDEQTQNLQNRFAGMDMPQGNIL